MNRFVNLAAGVTVFLLVILCQPASGQNINVTMRLNSATNLDTLRANHVVQIRGEAAGTVVPAVTWGEDTGLSLRNVGGDYWETTFQMAPGATLKFKFWTGFTGSAGTFFWTGWEGPITPGNPVDSGDNRWFVAGSSDTTLALQFYNGTATKRGQYWRPYEAKPDTFAVYFRVNMAAFMETGEFKPEAGDNVVVYGGKPLDPTATDSWNTAFKLTREEGSADNGAFFSGAVYVANSAVTAGAWQNFKFVYNKGGSPVWESTPNRFFQYASGAKDTTIHWTYFNNVKPSGGNIVEAALTWQVSTEGLEKLGLFDRAAGDRIVIDGAKAWASDMADAIQMNYVPLLKCWVGQETFTKAPGAVIEYKSVIIWANSRIDPTSSDYLPGLDLTSPLNYWEEPSVTGTGNRNYTFTNQTEQAIPGDYGFDTQFFNGLPAEGVIETPIHVTFHINMAPAADAAANTSNPLFRPGVDTAWVQFYGCVLPLTQGDGLYTNTPLLLSDPDGDLVYSGSMDLTPPVPYDAGFRVNYSSEGGATIQNGGGFIKGRSYYQYVQPVKVQADGSVIWPAEHTFPVLDWKDSDLDVEDPPDLWTPTGVNDGQGASVARNFELRQNYPNPFNPETAIDYQIAKTGKIEIGVYNLKGQLVQVLVNKKQNPGVYSIRWNGRGENGGAAPSGVYLLKMRTESFSQVRKLTLLR